MEKRGNYLRPIAILLLLCLLVVPFTFAATKNKANTCDLSSSAPSVGSSTSSAQIDAFITWFNNNQDASKLSTIYGVITANKNDVNLLVVTQSSSSSQPADSTACGGACARVITFSDVAGGKKKATVQSSVSAGGSYNNVISNANSAKKDVLQIMVTVADIQKIPHFEESSTKPTCEVHHFLSTSSSPNREIWHKIITPTGSSSTPGSTPKEKSYDLNSPPDGDKDQTTCEGLGYDWDSFGKCCGDDGLDHGQAKAEFSQVFDEAKAQQCLSDIPPKDCPSVLVGGLYGKKSEYPLKPLGAETQFCNMKQILGTSGQALSKGWVKASGNAGKTFRVLGQEYYSDGSKFVKPNACEILTATVSGTKYDTIYIDSKDTSAEPAERGHLIQCGPNSASSDTHPNDEASGGINKVIGDWQTCSKGATSNRYICVHDTNAKEYKWVEEKNFQSNPKYAESCSAIGSQGDSKRLSYVWTGSQCCYGTRTYIDPIATSNIGKTGWDTNGVCLFGRAYPQDRRIGKSSQDYLVNFGKLLGCNTLGNEGSSVAEKENYCAVAYETAKPLSGSTTSTPDYVCTYDGTWEEYPSSLKNEIVEATAKGVPPGANLLRNPGFDDDGKALSGGSP